jgi:saccharopine dehydrogenase-like NADP-dependent oxidoreductase
MKKIAVLGAGFVTKPAVDYFIDKCGYEVIVTSLEKAEADGLIDGRPLGKAFSWSLDQEEVLDRIVSEVDLVMSMIPPFMHKKVARACLKHQKNMVTTSYISPEMEALDDECRDRDIIILNEIGEDPGLDNMNTKRMIDLIREEKGEIIAVTSYGAGLPAFEHNNNPFGYKFSWSPKGLISAAQSSAAYLRKGNRVEIPSTELFNHHWLVDLDGIGSFETYPNRDAVKYLEVFGLDENVSLYRGLLRFTGWCNTMKSLADLGLLESTLTYDFSGMTFAQFTVGLIGLNKPGNILEQTADYLQMDRNADFIKKLKWLGFFSDAKIPISKGTRADVLVEVMVQRLSYTPFESDMVIVYTEILAEFSDRLERRTSSLLVKGEPGGDSAMSRAVSLPAAIASKLILEGKIRLKGVQRPTSKEIYHPVLEEMAGFGYGFETGKWRLE